VEETKGPQVVGEPLFMRTRIVAAPAAYHPTESTPHGRETRSRGVIWVCIVRREDPK